MDYRTLYRAYRPQKFEDVVGQLHITKTLQNAIASERVSHAYLFSGPRGTGKTTTAKILARALNCVHYPAVEPCNQCKNCQAIDTGTAVDVIEIDAASHRGIDDMRDLREKVKYAPAQGRARIYIIDEVHMLTTEAFNALLKTLEEPPDHAVFILATTEPHKLPVTILSRCQRFDFHRISLPDIIKRLEEVAIQAGLEVDPPALALIARAAEGGLRDALTILDQGAVYGNNQITAQTVHSLLGTVGDETLDSMVEHLGQADATQALTLVDKLFQQGKDLSLFVKELSAHLRGLLLELIAATDPPAGQLTPQQVARYLAVLAKVEYDMKWSSQPRLLLELALVKLVLLPPEAGAKMAPPTQGLKKPAQDLPPAPTTGKLKVPKTAAQQPKKLAADQAQSPPNVDPGEGKEIWQAALEGVKKAKPSLYAILCEAQFVGITAKVLTISFKPEHSTFHQGMAAQQENVDFVTSILEEQEGGSWQLRVTSFTAAEPVTKDGGKDSPDQDPLVRQAIELFGANKVVVSNHNHDKKE